MWICRAYILEVALLSCSLSYVFAGGHALLQLWRGLRQADTELLGGASLQPIICVQNRPDIHEVTRLESTLFIDRFK